jgi:hypothetical protein
MSPTSLFFFLSSVKNYLPGVFALPIREPFVHSHPTRFPTPESCVTLSHPIPIAIILDLASSTDQRHSSSSPVIMSFGSRRPTQHLNIRCSNCGVITVRFESFVADGLVFEMVGNKLSEMIAFISASPDVILCSACTEKATAEEQNRRQRKREQIMQQMELRPTVLVDPEPEPEPAAMYPQTRLKRKETKARAEREQVETLRPIPRRAFSQRETMPSARYFAILI